MTANYENPGLEPQNRPFALLYLRTTEGMRDANDEGEFSDPEFWDRAVIPTFADYYLDAYRAWSCEPARVHAAWRTAFGAEPDRLTGNQMIYLGINAHINNDLAFMIEDLTPGIPVRGPQARQRRAGTAYPAGRVPRDPASALSTAVRGDRSPDRRPRHLRLAAAGVGHRPAPADRADPARA
jgi:hypothetical protein